MKFRIAKSTTRSTELVEVLDEAGNLLAAIYAHDLGLHVVSKHLGDVIVTDENPPSALLVLDKKKRAR